MATATLKKPTAAKPALKAPAKPAAKPKGPIAAKKPPAKPAKAAKPAKEIKPFESGDIVIFKAYASPGEDQNFTEGMELAVVGTSERDGGVFIACVPAGQYHAYQADNDSVSGEELMDTEVKRTSRKVEAPYQLAVVGDVNKLLKSHDNDPLKVAKDLYGKTQEAFFYLGGMFAKLWKESNDEGVKLFATYKKPDGGRYAEDSAGFDEFLTTEFGREFGGMSKAKKLISVYETFSVLPDAAKVVKEIEKVGWWKASLIASYVTPDNAEQLVKEAANSSSTKLEETLKTKYTTAGNTTPSGKQASRTTIRRTTFGPYKLYEDQAEGVEYIMKAASKQSGIQDANALFEHIVTEWAGQNLGDVADKAASKAETKRKQLVKAGVKLPDDHPKSAKNAAAL